MSRKWKLGSQTIVALLVVAGANFANAQSPTAKTTASAASRTERALMRAAEQGKYTFLLFYKNVDDATRRMAAVLKAGSTKSSGQATVAYVRTDDAAERALVAKYGVARAPMPFTLVIAPNGAITGVFAQKLTAANVDDAFVTPTMMVTMKSLQAGKLVLIDAQGSSRSVRPAALKSFETDPHFKDRLVTISMRVADSRETKFVKQMQLDPSAAAGHIVLLAPPGVLVGKFQAGATKDAIAAALAKAGKCCNDAKCRHNK